jgi:hypothetical protein
VHEWEQANGKEKKKTKKKKKPRYGNTRTETTSRPKTEEPMEKGTKLQES